MSVLESLATLFKCTPNQLGDRLAQRYNRKLAKEFLVGKHFHRLYKPSERGNRRIKSLTIEDARHLHAFNGLYGITIQQYFFTVYRIHLRHPHLPCVVVKSRSGRLAFFPLELINLDENTNNEQIEEKDNESLRASPPPPKRVLNWGVSV